MEDRWLRCAIRLFVSQYLCFACHDVTVEAQLPREFSKLFVVYQCSAQYLDKSEDQTGDPRSSGLWVTMWLTERCPSLWLGKWE